MKNNFEKPDTKEEVRVIDGKKYHLVDSGHTIRWWYSHDGPGWDGRGILLKDEYTLKQLGRTFTEKEVYGPDKLPDTPYYEWRPIDEER
ncbi:MAG: hypothetical protein HY226_06100 [Candidatus Vogelbacteria bacterium]|nr:hypothetical protein [Candidatus Vogelbacteria bacterium]